MISTSRPIVYLFSIPLIMSSAAFTHTGGDRDFDLPIPEHFEQVDPDEQNAAFLPHMVLMPFEEYEEQYNLEILELYSNMHQDEIDEALKIYRLDLDELIEPQDFLSDHQSLKETIADEAAFGYLHRETDKMEAFENQENAPAKLLQEFNVHSGVQKQIIYAYPDFENPSEPKMYMVKITFSGDNNLEDAVAYYNDIMENATVRQD